MELTQIQKEVVDALPINPRGRLLLSPRLGKTPIAISLIKRDKPKSILWVTPSTELAENVIPSEFIKFKAKPYLKKLTVSTWKSLPKLSGYFDYIILDEEQYLTENNIKPILDNSLKSKTLLTMTGTPTKSYDKKQILHSLNLSTLYDISINEAVDIGLLSNYQINIINISLSSIKNVKIEYRGKYFYTSEKDEYEYFDRLAEKAISTSSDNVQFAILNRMRKIYENSSKFKVAYTMFNSDKFKNHRKIIFCPTIRQSEQMCQYTYHSKTNNEDLLSFVNGEINSISMVNSGGIGFTYKEVDDLFLVQADSDINGYTSQKICRALLKQPNHKVNIWIFNLLGTKDEKWVKSALQNFKPEKINYDYQLRDFESLKKI